MACLYTCRSDKKALVDCVTGDSFLYSQFDHVQLSSLNIPRFVGLVMHRDIATIVAYICLIREGYSVSMVDPEYTSPCWFDTDDLFVPCILSTIEDHKLESSSRDLRKAKLLHYDINIYSTHANSTQNVYESILSFGQFITLNTSGSSGSPKLVPISTNNLLSNTSAIIRSLSISQDDSAITILPIHYTYGLSVINMILSTGGTVFISSISTVQPQFRDLLLTYQPTIFTGVPYHFEIEKKLSFRNILTPSIKKITQAGGKLAIKLQQQIVDHILHSEVKFFVMYGQTEATARISCFDLASYPSKIGSVGRLLDNLTVSTKPTRDKPSEILIEGPSVTMGPLTSWSALKNNQNINLILHTGDIGYFDDDHFLYITGRASRFAKIAGVRFNLDSLEQELTDKYNTPVYLVSDDIKLFIFILENHQFSSKPKITGIHPTLIKVVGIIEPPLKSSGKIDYTALLDIASHKV